MHQGIETPTALESNGQMVPAPSIEENSVFHLDNRLRLFSPAVDVGRAVALDATNAMLNGENIHFL